MASSPRPTPTAAGPTSWRAACRPPAAGSPWSNGAPGDYTAENEAKRQAVNAWMRSSREFDGVIDFDAALRDPAHPSRFLPAYDSGDHLHPNDAGYKAMGDAVDLALFD